MKNLSITFSEDIAKESKQAAKELGISRAEFIRQATVHELKLFKIQSREKKIVECFKAMKECPEYLKELDQVEEEFYEELLPEEEEEWWTKH